MRILTISGSNRIGSSNKKLVEALPFLFPKQDIYGYDAIYELPLFQVELDKNPLPQKVKEWRRNVKEADAIIFCTPVYIYNIPASIKNALEWLASSGELDAKPVLAMTFTPNPPRGEKAMQSLLWSLQALNSRIVAQLPLYQTDIVFDENGKLKESEGKTLLLNAIEMLF